MSLDLGVEIGEAIGLVAGTLTTIAFLPQVFRVWQRRSARDISLPTFILLCSGVALWLLSGVLKESISLILANGVTFFLAMGILVGKLRFDRR
ncbi:SemiSWEET transporter [Marinibaculum pumilum]|uniref:SemiSWEET transporter n=1 Tax=Marinibaculum pumilum TaxID=1766165 RepID=A0ABV7L689_9PROT